MGDRVEGLELHGNAVAVPATEAKSDGAQRRGRSYRVPLVPPHDARRRPQGSIGSNTPSIAQATEVLRDAEPEVGELHARAAWLGGLGREPLVSFSSLFLAFLGGGKPVADWVRATADATGVSPAAILARWRAARDGSYPDEISIDSIRRPGSTSARVVDTTRSAQRVLNEAKTLQSQLGAATLTARHLFGAWLLTASSHEADLRAWQLRRRSWLARFTLFVAREAPGEAELWRMVWLRSLTPRYSTHLFTVFNAAAALAIARRAARPEVEDLVRGLLFCGSQWADQNLTNVWLIAKLGSDLHAALRVPATLPGFNESSTTEVDLSGVADWLNTARLYALACPLDVCALRHVVAALVSPRGPAVGKRMLREAGGEPTKIARSLAELIGNNEKDEDIHTWLAILKHDAPPRAIRKPGYASDIARGEDLMSIEDDVHALAAVLASATTEPPLSVGLFGNWGSGKSFFMAKMRDHITELARQSATAERSAFCSRIAQIEFNAWHYVDSELWPSLVHHLLDSLERHFRGDEKSLAEQRKQELAATQLQRADLDRRQRELDERRDELARKVAVYQPTNVEIVEQLSQQARTLLRSKLIEDHPVVRSAIDGVAQQLGVDPATLDLAKLRTTTSTVRAW